MSIITFVLRLSTILTRAAICSLVIAIAVVTGSGEASSQQRLTIANYGGSSGEVFSKTIWQPTAEKLGITIKEDSLNSLTDVRTQVTANAVEFDIVEIEVDECAQAQKEGLLEKLNYDEIKPRGYGPMAITPTYILTNTASYVVGWNTKSLGDNGPKSWADFWNVQKFPGTRALRNNPAQNLEAALIADGVPLDKLYPLDIDRAFKKLAEIKPHIAVWWTSGAQSAQLVKDGEVDMLGVWNNRMQAVINDGAKAKYVYNGGLLIPDCYAIPKGSKNVALATKALAIALSPDLQAQMTKYIPLSPVTTDAYKNGLIPPNIQAILPAAPQNVKDQVWMDGDWWATHGAEVQEKWTNFMQQ
jgi:putative spermidine/putrescine transport system substrate-binding protein